MSEQEPIRTVADVKISKDKYGAISCVINGEEMNRQILANSLSVTFPQDKGMGGGCVSLTLWADVDIDITDAEVEIR